MAHNPSYLGKTHVVTHHHGGRGYWDEQHEVIGVHGDYGSARNAIDKHLGTKAHRTPGDDPVYHHPEHEVGGDPEPIYKIHRDEGGGKWKRV